MKLLINGKENIVEKNILLSTLLEKLNLNSNKIIVQVNQEIINKSNHSTFELQKDSSIDILAIVGGG